MIEKELGKLLKDAETNKKLRQALLSSKESSEPMKSFCEICQNNGYEIYPGELFAYGQDMNDSKLRATNGGGSFAIEGWEDSFENILEELKRFNKD